MQRDDGTVGKTHISCSAFTSCNFTSLCLSVRSATETAFSTSHYLQQTMPTNSANYPMAESTEQRWPSIKEGPEPEPDSSTPCVTHPSSTPDRPDFRRTDWAKFHTHLEREILFNPELLNGMAVDTCVENFSRAVFKALAASTPKCHPRDDPRFRSAYRMKYA
jgi:hypothetical protein